MIFDPSAFFGKDLMYVITKLISAEMLASSDLKGDGGRRGCPMGLFFYFIRHGGGLQIPLIWT